jgi:hypothetical protein
MRRSRGLGDVYKRQLIFLMGFILPYWITLGLFEQLRPKRIFEEEKKS